jgi:hypothetical protein
VFSSVLEENTVMTEKARSALPAKLWSWHEHVCACQASGQTMVAYAKAHRLSVQAFYRAKARLLRYGAGQLSPLGSLFQRVEVVSARPRLSSCRVHLPNGVVVELGVEDAGLGRVLQAAGALS